jgi:hypothetical protein
MDAKHQRLLEQLTYLDRLAKNADRESLAVLAPDELPRLIRGLRAVLAPHTADAHGRCRRCNRWRPWRRALPCDNWDRAYEEIMVAAPSNPTGPVVFRGGPR